MDIKKQAVANLKRPAGRRRRPSEPSRPPEPSIRPKASVLVPLFVQHGELYVLLTLRSEQLRTNAGDVCFPGGKSDPGDPDETSTALREAEEEIGLPPDRVEVCALLDPIVSKGGLLVTPVVGFIDGSFRPCPNPAEVSEVFAVPLNLFIQKKDHSAIAPAGGSLGLHCFDFVEPDSGRRYQIWGLTAAIAILVAVLALGKRPEFDTGFDSRQSADGPNSRLFRRLLSHL